MTKSKKPNNFLRMERKNRGWSQARLAEMIDADTSMISRWECGARKPEHTYQEKLCNLFQKSALELGLIDDPDIINSHLHKNTHSLDFSVQNENVSSDMQMSDGSSIIQMLGYTGMDVNQARRVLLQEALSIASSIVLSNNLLNLEPWERLRYALRKPSSIDENVLRYLEMRVNNYWQNHYNATLTSFSLYNYVLDDFTKVTTLLEGAHLPTARTRLCIIASEIAQLLGTLLFDMGNYTHSRHLKQVAISAAQEAGNQELESVAWGRLSMAWMYDNNLQEALESIQKARLLSLFHTNTATHAWLAVVEAEIQSKLGNRQACLKALDDAECIEEQPNQDPYWLHFDRSSLTGYQGVCFQRLYNSDDQQTNFLLEKAQIALMSSLASPALAHRRPTILADLADTYIQQKEVGEACRLASEAISTTNMIKSQRNVQRLFALRSNLDAWRDTQHVKDLDKQLHLLSAR